MSLEKYILILKSFKNFGELGFPVSVYISKYHIGGRQMEAFGYFRLVLRFFSYAPFRMESPIVLLVEGMKRAAGPIDSCLMSNSVPDISFKIRL